MPRLDGVEATRRLAERELRARILILTTFDLDEYVYAAMRAGASGFLLKDVPPSDLVDAIRVVAAGNSLFGPAATKRLVERFGPQRDPSAPTGSLDDLTEREREILRLLAPGMSNAELAPALVVGEATVKTHVSAVLRSSASATACRQSSRPTTPASSGRVPREAGPPPPPPPPAPLPPPPLLPPLPLPFSPSPSSLSPSLP